MSKALKLAAPISNPRSYCAANRQPPFRGHHYQAGAPVWHKLGRGLLAITDGTPR